MKLLTKTTDIEKAITSINKRGKTLDRDIHVAACSALNHCAQHNDTIYINRLIESMPKGSRVNALRDFMEKFGNIAYNEETKVFDYKKGKKADIEKAQEKSWTEFKPEPQFKGFDLEQQLKQVLVKASKMLQDSNPEHQSKIKVDTNQVEALAELLGIEVEVEQVEAVTPTKAPDYKPEPKAKKAA